MAKKKIKKEVEKTDFLLKAIDSVVTFIRNNMRLCIIGAIIVIVVCTGVYGYTYYEKKQHEKSQTILFQGIDYFEQYTLTGTEENLNKAEELLTVSTRERRGNIQRIAKLYLAKISYLKGKKDEAKKVYQELANAPSRDVIRMLAEKSLKQMEQ